MLSLRIYVASLYLFTTLIMSIGYGNIVSVRFTLYELLTGLSVVTDYAGHVGYAGRFGHWRHLPLLEKLVYFL